MDTPSPSFWQTIVNIFKSPATPIVISIIAVILAWWRGGKANRTAEKSLGIAKETHEYTLKVDKEQKKIDKENILKAIEIIENKLSKVWKVRLGGEQISIPEWPAATSDYPERFKNDLDEIIQYYPNHIQIKLRHAIQPFYEDTRETRHWKMFWGRCMQVKNNFAMLRKEAETS